jgi:transposase
MFQVEIYGRVRRAVRVEGQSQRAVAKEFGLSRETVRKMLQYAVPPGYQRQQPINRPKLGPWLGVIDAILEDDKQRPVKQRHTAKRIFERLKEEHGFTGGYTIVKDYVRGEQLHTREMFVPLTHAPGEAQVDFGEALVVIAGVEQKAHYLAMDLPHSDDCFCRGIPGRGHRGVSRRPCTGLRILRWRAYADSLRQQRNAISRHSVTTKMH